MQISQRFCFKNIQKIVYNLINYLKKNYILNDEELLKIKEREITIKHCYLILY